MLLKQQENNPVNTAKNILASNSVTPTTKSQVFSGSVTKPVSLPVPSTASIVMNKPSVPQSTNEISNNISEKFKNLPAGITLTVERKGSPGPPEPHMAVISEASSQPIYQGGKTGIKSNSPGPRTADPTIQRSQNYMKKVSPRSKLAHFRNQVLVSLFIS